MAKKELKMRLLKMTIHICSNNEILREQYLAPAIDQAAIENDIDAEIACQIIAGLDKDDCEPISTAGGEFAESLECETLEVVVDFNCRFEYWNGGPGRVVSIEVPETIEPLDDTTQGDERDTDEFDTYAWMTASDDWLKILQAKIASEIDHAMAQAAEKVASVTVQSYINCEN